MEPQFRTRGIYRPNAQRLSISLAPLVAQRSLLFRVKADLATKTHYGQLTPTTDESGFEDSPGLFAFTASAQIISAVLTVASVISAASVYSQESWKGNHSPVVSKLNMDTRRHAIAFSPSLQWSDLSSARDPVESALEHELVEVPLHSAPVSLKETKEDVHYAVPMPLPMDLIIPPTKVVSQPEAVHVDEKADAKLKKKKKSAEDASSRISKRSKAFSKVMSRISLQPSKKELSALERRQTVIPTTGKRHLPEFNLSELKPIDNRKTLADYRLPEVKTPGPIRMSFIIGATQTPQVPILPQALAPLFVPLPSISEPTMAENPANSQKDAQSTERARRFHSTMMPDTPSWRKRSLTPPPPLSAMPTPTFVAAAAPPKKGHRRYKSSPAVMNFDFHGWDEEPMPPLPPMPVLIPAGMKLAPAPATPGPRVSGRARSQSVVVRPPGARRAVAVPFPPPRARQASF